MSIMLQFFKGVKYSFAPATLNWWWVTASASGDHCNCIPARFNWLLIIVSKTQSSNLLSLLQILNFDSFASLAMWLVFSCYVFRCNLILGWYVTKPVWWSIYGDCRKLINCVGAIRLYGDFGYVYVLGYFSKENNGVESCLSAMPGATIMPNTPSLQLNKSILFSKLQEVVSLRTANKRKYLCNLVLTSFNK